MSINRWVAFALFIIILSIFISINVYAHKIYAPAPTPVIYKTYSIRMNLTDSRPTTSFLEEISKSYPLLYKEDSLVENTTLVWAATAGKEFTLYIANASITSIGKPVLLSATATANSTGGITWQLRVLLWFVFPESVYANWYVVITENISGTQYVVFAFETANESLSDLLNNLTQVGGYLIAKNNEPYYLWHYYYGYNPTTKSVSTYYEVGLPGISLFYTFIGQGINATPWPKQGFQEVLKLLEYGFSEYFNSTFVSSVVLPYNKTIGEVTNYGYTVYQRPRLVPFGPIIYVSPIVLLPNGTIVNPTCVPNTYFNLTIYYVTPAQILIPIYMTKNYPLGLYLLNDSLLFGGYLQAYDFYNESVIPITPIQYLEPPYKAEVDQFTMCTITIYTPTVNETHMNATNIITNNTISTTIYDAKNTSMIKNNANAMFKIELIRLMRSIIQINMLK
ncbi:MAG: hypothetical protein TU36_003950 [Vulcanisaeta sp. AZ3]